MWWPSSSDPFYVYNPDEAAARIAYYDDAYTAGPAGGYYTPSLQIDGVFYDIWYIETIEEYVQWWTDSLTARQGTYTPLAVTITGEFDHFGGIGSVDVEIFTEDIVPGDYDLQVILTESDLPLGMSMFQNVMRDMIPDAGGTLVTLAANDSQVLTFDIATPEPLLSPNVRVTAFVQDTTTKAVLNAGYTWLSDIEPAPFPLLSLEEYNLEIDDLDDDGKLSPGDAADLDITLENFCRWANAEGVTGVLSSSSEFITITDANVTYGNIDNCETASGAGDLFAFEISSEAPGAYEFPFTLSLTANSGGENPYAVDLTFEIPVDMNQVNFPVSFQEASGQGNAIIDLDGDGELEVILGDAGGLVHAINAMGEELPGFPANVNDGISGSPAIADIDNDGDLEIVVGSRDNNLYVIQHDGSAEAIVTANGYLMATPSLADLDDDGDYEIIAPGYGRDIQIVHHDGSHFGASPLYVDPERMVRGAAVAHINDHTLWVIVVSTQSGNLHVLDMLGDELAGFPVSLGAGSQSDVSVADLDGDGNLEILVGADNTSLHCVSFTGEILWTHQNGIAPVRSSPAIVDLVANGGLEVAFISMDGQLWVLDAAGALVDGWPQSVGSFSLSSPVAADIDNDGTPELFAGSDDEYLYGFYADGTPVEGFPVFADNMIKTIPTVADLDEDGNPELIAGTSGGLTAIDIKSTSGTIATWFTDQGSYLRDGVFPQGATLIDPGVVLPRELSLSPNYPNPFNPDTRVSYGLPEAGMARIAVYDVLGREVIELAHEFQSAGWYDLVWQGVDEVGREVATGVYYMKLNFGTENRLIKMLLMK